MTDQKIRHKCSIITISIPRSGTNYFSDQIGSFPEIAGLMEIFNPRGVYGIAQHPNLMARYGDLITEKASESEGLVELFQKTPLRAVDTLSQEISENPDLKYLSYKIFPNQVREEALRIIHREHTLSAIVIVRARLEVFVSYKKAIQSDVWHNQDTSAVKVSITLEEFLEWARQQDEWYETQEKTLRQMRIPFIILSYNADINVPPEVLREKLYFLLRSMNAQVSFPEGQAVSHFKRQDAVGDVFDKIENGAELRAQLAETGQLGYALRTPLSA